MSKNILSVIENLKNGIQPIVKINDHIYEDSYLEDGMSARLIGAEIEDDSDPEDIVYLFFLDFSEFDAENTAKETRKYLNSRTGNYELTSTEAGFKPKSLKAKVCHSVTLGEMFFSLNDDNMLFKKYMEEKSDITYTKWLENIVNGK